VVDQHPVEIDSRWVFPDGMTIPVVRGGTGPVGEPPAPAPAGEPAPASEPAPVVEPPAPAPEPEPSLADGDAAARARLLGGEPPDALVGDDARYRDVKGIREDIARVREQYGPLAEAFGGLDDQGRQSLIAAAPAMGANLVFAAEAFSGLAQEDQEVLLSIVAMIPEDPAGAASLMAEAAQLLSGGTPGAPAPAPGAPGAPAPEVDDEDDLLSALGFERGDPNRPITQADFDRMLTERDNARELERLKNQQADEMLRTARDLGYDPQANPNTPDGRTARAKAGLLFHLARLHGSDDPEAITKADADIKAMDQRTIDQYVEGLKSDGSRPQPPAGGAPPSDGRVLETLEDAEAAMKERVARSRAQQHQV
jgi:hypothetical protein